MRRVVIILALMTACALTATSASAQVEQHQWFLNAGIGPSFGSLGSTSVVDASAGYKLNDHVSIAGEFGVLPHAPFDKAASVAPTVSPLVPSADVHVNAYHTNANLFVQASPWGRLAPYATVGVGAFTGSTVANATFGNSRVTQYDRDTNAAENFGVGATYRLTTWLGVNADYRHFIVNAEDTQHINRFTTGVSVFVR
jgi:opacity protein-like surface antigen